MERLTGHPLEEKYQTLPVTVKNYLYLGEILTGDVAPRIRESLNESRLEMLNGMTHMEKSAMIDYIAERDRKRFRRTYGKINR